MQLEVVLCIGLFYIIFLVMLFISLINFFKSLKYKKIKAKVIDSVELYSKEWKSYFPEEYEDYIKKSEKIKNAKDRIDNISNSIGYIKDSYDKIPIKVKNNADISINLNKNRRMCDQQEELFNNEKEKESSYYLVAEYIIDNKKYYFCNNISTKQTKETNMIGKYINLKYDPTNPKKSIYSKSSFKVIIFSLIFLIILTFLVILILQENIK